MWKHIKSHLYSKSGAKVYKIAQIYKKCAIIYVFNTKKKLKAVFFIQKKAILINHSTVPQLTFQSHLI